MKHQVTCLSCKKRYNVPTRLDEINCHCGSMATTPKKYNDIYDFLNKHNKNIYAIDMINGTKKASFGIRSQRQKICNNCEEYNKGSCGILGGAYGLAMNYNVSSCPLDKWIVKWKPVNDHIEPQHKNLVITVATGESFQELFNITGPKIEQYAKKCSADFVALTNTTQDWWGLEKFRVLNYAQQYERTLFIDSDVIILDKTPNLFEVIPSDRVAMHDDFPYMAENGYNDDRDLICDDQKVEPRTNNTALNTGVVMCSKSQADIWAPPPRPFQPIHCYEQIWIEHNAFKYNVWPIPSNLNFQYWFDDFWDLLPQALLIHLAACDDRIATANKILELYEA